MEERFTTLDGVKNQTNAILEELRGKHVLREILLVLSHILKTLASCGFFAFCSFAEVFL